MTTIIAVGIDLAVSHLHTGVCVLKGGPDGLTAEFDRSARHDSALADLMVKAYDHATVAVDVPLGWPQRFRDFMSALDKPGAADKYLAPNTTDVTSYRFEDLRLRSADIALRRHFDPDPASETTPHADRPWPLSVSTDKLGAATMRWHAIGARMRADDHHAVFEHVIETYPAAARCLWGWDRPKPYEPQQLGLAAFTMVPWRGGDAKPVGAADLNNHEWDALAAALVARCEARQTFPKEPSAQDRREGVIHLPIDESSTPKVPDS